MRVTPQPDAPRPPSSQWASLDAPDDTPRQNAAACGHPLDLVMDLQPFDARPSPAPSPQRWFRKHSAKDWSLAPPLDFGATQPMEYGELPHIGDPVAEALQFREELRGLQVRELNSQTLFNHFFGTEPD